MKIVVIGSTGTIGAAVVRALSSRHEVIGVHRHGDPAIDITQSGSIKNLFDKITAIDAVVSCAGGAAWKPLDQLGDDDFARSLGDKLMGQVSTEIAPEVRKTLEAAQKTFRSAEQRLQSDSPVQGDLRETLLELTKAAEQLRSLADYLERHPESLIRGKRTGSDKK